MGLTFYVSLLLFVAVIIAVLAKPKNLNIAIPPIIGSIVLLLTGIIKIKDVLYVWDVVWNATFTLVAIILLSIVLDRIGFFSYLAVKIAKRSGGSIARLFFFIIFLSAGVSAVFSNDGSILVMTPITYEVLKNINAERKSYFPFLVATGFICDAASTPLSISNLVNIISTGFFSIRFLDYFYVMAVPDLVTIFLSSLLLFLLFKKSIGSRFDVNLLPDPDSFVRDRPLFMAAFFLTGGLIVAYAIASSYLVPISFIAIPSVFLFSVIAIKRKCTDSSFLLRKTPWAIIFFSFGMFIVVYALAKTGLSLYIGSLFLELYGNSSLAGYLAIGFVISFFASVMNNLPSVILVNITISSIHLKSLVFLNVLANDIGTKMTPIGSLATLLWLNILRGKGERIDVARFMKTGVIVTIPVLLAGISILWLILAM